MLDGLLFRRRTFRGWCELGGYDGVRNSSRVCVCVRASLSVPLRSAHSRLGLLRRRGTTQRFGGYMMRPDQSKQQQTPSTAAWFAQTQAADGGCRRVLSKFAQTQTRRQEEFSTPSLSLRTGRNREGIQQPLVIRRSGCLALDIFCVFCAGHSTGDFEPEGVAVPEGVHRPRRHEKFCTLLCLVDQGGTCLIVKRPTFRILDAAHGSRSSLKVVVSHIGSNHFSYVCKRNRGNPDFFCFSAFETCRTKANRRFSYIRCI